jgi:hypothetical protein
LSHVEKSVRSLRSNQLYVILICVAIPSLSTSAELTAGVGNITNGLATGVTTTAFSKARGSSGGQYDCQ